MAGAKSSVSVILVPYHVGILNHRVGLGPQRLLPRIIQELEKQAYIVHTHLIEPVDDQEGEIGRSFELLRRVSRAVSAAVDAASFPLVLAGNCMTSAGVAAGLRASKTGVQDLGVLWMDAHNDAGRPETLRHGYFDGMGVTMMNGSSWNALMSTVPGHEAVSMKQVIYCGVRNQSQEEVQQLTRDGAALVDGNPDLLEAQLDAYNKDGRIRDLLVHVDLDVLDPEKVGWANEFPSRGGMSAQNLIECMGVAAKRGTVALTVASFMPDLYQGSSVEEAVIDGVNNFMENWSTD